jgi:hypothetical protein
MSNILTHTKFRTKSNLLDDEPQIKNGIYPVIYHSHYFENKFGRDILVLQFQIVELNEKHKNSLFVMRLNVKYFSKNKKGQINFNVSKCSKLAETWVNIFPAQEVKRWDRLPLSQLKGLILDAKIEQGKKNYQQKLKNKALRISKVVDLSLPNSLP